MYHTKEPQILNKSAIEEVLPLLIQQGQFVLDTGILQYSQDNKSYHFIAKLLQTNKELQFKFEDTNTVEGTDQKEKIMRAKQITISLEAIQPLITDFY